jgi:hypothetical protein
MFKIHLAILAFIFWSSIANAATYFVAATGGSGIACTQASPCTLATALGVSSPAIAGDTIMLNDGTYTGTFSTGKAGSAGNPIILRALNQHKAILRQSSQSCANSASTAGLTIQHANWIVRDIKFQFHTRVINIVNVSGITIQHNIVENFTEAGIFSSGTNATGNTIRDNVIGLAPSCVMNRQDAGIFIADGDSNTVENNIVYGIGDNSSQASAVGVGSGIVVANNSDNNLLRGNLVFAIGGKEAFRMLAGANFTLTGNIVRDNAILWSEGGILGSDDCADDSNQFLNNLVVGVFHSLSGTKGNVDSKRGNHLWKNNTLVQTVFTRLGHASGSGGCGGRKVGLKFKDNLILADYTPGVNHPLMYVDNMDEYNKSETGFNLFWNPGSAANRFRVYSPANTDIQSQPIFVSQSTGDFSLAAGSPGKKAASDGSDVGVTYNSFLNKSRLANAFALETQQNNSLAGNTSFTVSPNHFYQVWFFVPESGSCSLTNEVFTIEGVGISRDISTIKGIWINSTDQRWITLGRHRATDGTLNISWTTGPCADKVFIRKLPTVDEAFAWITGAMTPAPSPPPPPSLALPAAPGSLLVQ